MAASAGYFLLGLSPMLLGAGFAVIVAHGGGSTCWVFSTTLLQLQTDHRFRGRVFSAEFALNVVVMAVVVMAVTGYSAGVLADAGVDIHHVAMLTGASLLIPGILWTVAQKRWEKPSLFS